VVKQGTAASKNSKAEQRQKTKQNAAESADVQLLRTLHEQAQQADDFDMKARFLMLQLLHALAFAHSKNTTLSQNGALRSERIFVRDDGWLQLTLPVHQELKKKKKGGTDAPPPDKDSTTPDGEDSDTSCSEQTNINNTDKGPTIANNHNSMPAIKSFPGAGLSPTRKWRNGTMSNLDYLLLLNESAGRTVGDPAPREEGSVGVRTFGVPVVTEPIQQREQ